MFTGLVQESAVLKEFTGNANVGWRLVVESKSPEIFKGILGASIALNGACMTLVHKHEAEPGSWYLSFDISKESFDRTNFCELSVGKRLHLERAMTLSDFVGGHLVSGHVDAVGTLQSLEESAAYALFTVRVEGPARLKIAPYLVEKGSIAVDGVSLTVNAVVDAPSFTDFHITLIPHTLKSTRFRDLPLGAKLNLEADLVAKYIDRAQSFRQKESSHD